jgi:predicted metal-dependent phosphoesterase TrpH
MIREAGGLAVLAHPKQLRAKNDEELNRVLDRLVADGLGGIEAYSSSQNQSEAERYRKAGEARNILITGGSDFHGGNKTSVELGVMGDWAKLSYQLIDSMRSAIRGRAS